MDYMIVYPLPENYKDTAANRQKVIEKFKRLYEAPKFHMKIHLLDRVYNTYKKRYKYVCLSSCMERPEYYENMPKEYLWDNFIILHEDDNNISIGEL